MTVPLALLVWREQPAPRVLAQPVLQEAQVLRVQPELLELRGRPGRQELRALPVFKARQELKARRELALPEPQERRALPALPV